MKSRCVLDILAQGSRWPHSPAYLEIQRLHLYCDDFEPRPKCAASGLQLLCENTVVAFIVTSDFVSVHDTLVALSLISISYILLYLLLPVHSQGDLVQVKET